MQQKAMNRKDEIDSAKAIDTSKDGVGDQKPRFDRRSGAGSTCSLFHVGNVPPGKIFSWIYVQSSELQGLGCSAKTCWSGMKLRVWMNRAILARSESLKKQKKRANNRMNTCV